MTKTYDPNETALAAYEVLVGVTDLLVQKRLFSPAEMRDILDAAAQRNEARHTRTSAPAAELIRTVLIPCYPD